MSNQCITFYFIKFDFFISFAIFDRLMSKGVNRFSCFDLKNNNDVDRNQLGY